MESQLLVNAANMLIYSPLEIVVNMILATGLGCLISIVYRYTHKGLSYSQSFTLTIIFVTLIVCIVMMVIGSSLARAFALVGALSIIRFRTVIKDTKDTAYIFIALALGMAAGTGNYFLAVAALGVFTALAVVLHKLNYGALYKSEFIIRFSFEQEMGSALYLDLIKEYAVRSNLLHIEPSGDGEFLSLTYDFNLKEGQSVQQFASAFGRVQGVSEVTFIASKNDVDY
jgi:hypothetical protein